MVDEDEEALNALGKVNTDDPWACQAAIVKFLAARKQLRGFEQFVLGTVAEQKRIEQENKENDGNIIGHPRETDFDLAHW